MLDEDGYMSWQPIETAPRDGTAIIAWLRLNVERPELGWVGLVRYKEHPSGAAWTSMDDQYSCDLSIATHWMPLPEAPYAPLKREPEILLRDKGCDREHSLADGEGERGPEGIEAFGNLWFAAICGACG